MTDAQFLALIAVVLYGQNGGSIEAALQEAQGLITAARECFDERAPEESPALDLSGFRLTD